MSREAKKNLKKYPVTGIELIYEVRLGINIHSVDEVQAELDDYEKIIQAKLNMDMPVSVVFFTGQQGFE